MKRVISGTYRTASTGVPKLLSLFMLVGWPYILKKLDKFCSLISAYAAMSNSRKIPILYCLVRYYPWFKILFTTWAFLLKIGYILSWCSTHRPELIFANVHLEKLAPADFMSYSTTDEKGQWRTLAVLFGMLTRCITFGLYFIQFLDFYHNSDAGQIFHTEQRKSNWKCPPAPHKILRESSVLLLETNKCPLCLRQRTNDTALAVSGYVFCYECIYSYVQKERKCPVTGLPASVDDLIRIFVRAA